jgi:uncharacterized membrane protein YbhN (UPF0104 family)
MEISNYTSKVVRFFARRQLLLRATISVALILWLLSQLDLAQMVTRWSTANWLLLSLLIPFLYLLNMIVRAARLRIILHAQGLTVPFHLLWMIQLKSSFFISFVPGGAAGDIYRTVAIGREIKRVLDSIASVLLEKFIGLAAMMLLSIASLITGVYLLDLAPYSNIARPVFVLALALLAAWLLFFALIRGQFLKRRGLPISFPDRLQDVSEQLYFLFGNSRILAKLGLLSFLLQVSIVFWYFTVARAMHLDISLLALMIGVPVIELLLAIPISVGGIGVRDSALVVLLLPFGLNAEDIVSFSLLVAFTATLARTLSGLAFIADAGEEQSGLDGSRDVSEPA